MKQKHVHLVMQGKGGVGKTLISYLLAQYYSSLSQIVQSYDVDGTNQSLSLFEELKVKKFDVVVGDNFNTKAFDDLVAGLIDENNLYDHAIIDSGASSFVPLNKYMLQSETVPLLLQNECYVMIHSIVYGGQGILDTLNGLYAIASCYKAIFPPPKLVVWLNAKDAPVEYDGVTFKESRVYEMFQDHISAVVELPRFSGVDFDFFQKMLQKHLTFTKVRQDPTFTLWQKHRMYVLQNSFFNSIQMAGL